MVDIPCGDKILDYLVIPALKKLLHPIFCFQSIGDEFHNQNKKLSALQEKVENEVQRDRNSARVIYNSVEEWLKEVNAAMPEVRRVENGLEMNKCCFQYTWCPNWTCHYRFSNQVSEITATMKELCANGEFSSVSQPPRLHQDIIGSSTSTCFMHSHSSKLAFDQIMEALKSDDVSLIGLRGGVGTGKTTLVEQVALEAKDIFHHVILVPVSQKPDVRRIQGLIADFLNLPLEQLESDQARATTLQLRLKNGDNILIIIDEVWKDFHLGAVGIPSLGCKLLLTMHTKTQLPISMHTQRDIELGNLSLEEAWTLFESVAYVGDEVRMHGVAEDALVECYGLPKAVVTIGRALNGKNVSEWREILQQLKAAKFKIFNILKEDAKNLSLRQERVKTKIMMAKQNVHEIYPDVEKWLKDVNSVMNDIDQFDNELNKNKWCFDERDVETRVEEMEVSVKGLYAKADFEQVSYPIQLVQDMEVLSSEEFMFSNAAKFACAQIMDAMKTDGVNMIGMYGMGGIGKTTLANQVQKEVVRHNIFDHAVMVTVSQKPNVGDMQHKIAEVLGFDEIKKIESLEGRASKLKLRLKDEKILIIVDDVWKQFDLRSIGVTLDDCKACKVLVTTRRRIVCSDMNCQQEIQLKLFSEDESQSFFKKKAGLSSEFELDDVAKKIVDECKCLPIALETVGAALKNKGTDEWTEALEKLRNAKLVDIIGVDDEEKNAYKCVKISYDYLKGPTQTQQAQAQQAQFILLLCSLYPEDYNIEVDDLIRYAFGMELFDRISSIEDARRNVRVTIQFLKDSCLLLDIGDELYVKMHDVVRDTVLWLGGTEARERMILTVRDNMDMKDLIKKKSFQNCRAVSFMPGVIHKLSKYNMLDCPNLETVLIFTKGEDFELGEEFFEHMKLLKVLNIKAAWRWNKGEFAIPRSLNNLEYIRTLMLRYCKCSNTSVLRELRKLKILSLYGCEIGGGVEVVSGLKKLRLLDLSELKAEKRMLSSNVMETFRKLEELHGYSVAKCKDEEVERSSLSELMLPSNLVALSIDIEDPSCLPTSFYFPDVTKYYICVGVNSGLLRTSEKLGRCLELTGNIKDESAFISTCKKLLPTIQDLYLKNCNDLRSLEAFNSHVEGYLQRLEILEVEECNIIEWMFESAIDNNIIQLQFLKILKLKWLGKLKHIWKGPARLVSLRNLTQVEISWCRKLTSIFPSPSLVTSMQRLEILKIRSCDNLEEIISKKGGIDDDDFGCCCYFTNLRELEVSACGKVKTIFPIVNSACRDPHLHLQSRCCLPKLQSIVLESNDQLQHIFGHQTQAKEGVECPSLQVLVVTKCANISTTHFVTNQLQPLKANPMDNVQRLGQQLQRQHGDLSQNTIICSSALKRVELVRCKKLKRVFTTSFITSLQLEELIVRECNELEEVISEVGDGKENSIRVCFENLKTLKVSRCGKLKTIFPVPVALPKLDTLALLSNAELEHVFGQSDWDHTWRFPFLNLCLLDCPKMCSQFGAYIQNISATKTERIELGNIKGVEKIMHIERKKDNDNVQLLNCRLIELGLLNLTDLNCIWRGCTQNLSFAYLLRVKVIGCVRLKHLLETTTLPRLEELTVEKCNALEQVIVMAENGKGSDANRAVFQNLKNLRVSECGKLKTIFPIVLVLPKLKSLHLKSNTELEHVFGQFDWDCTWQYLEHLCVVDCPKMCTQWIQNVSTGKEMKTIQAVEDNNFLSLPLRTLSVRNIDELNYIWRAPAHNIRFENLLQIDVIGCNNLKHIFVTAIATSLPMLEKLIVQRCNELEQVIMVGDGKEERDTVAKRKLDGFQKLQLLHVGSCEKLKTIFSIFIPLPELECLRLESNVKLESVFGQSECDYTCQWTRLEVLSVTGCPKLCSQFFATVKSQLHAAKRLWMINLSNIDGVDEIVEFEREDDDEREEFQVVKLEEVRELKRIWSGPTQNISFSYIVALKVVACCNLKHVFTTTMAITLHNLKLLWLERCHHLEHVIQEDGIIQSSVHQLFSSLQMLTLIDLPKLLNFCPSSCNLVFTSLTNENLKVEGCPQPVTDFFSKQSYYKHDDDKDENDDSDFDSDSDSDDGSYFTKRSMEEILGIPRGGLR